MTSKSELKINGEHSSLGRELSMQEFKGFTTAKVDSIEKSLLEIKKSLDVYTPISAKNEARSSFNFKLTCLMFVAILGVYATILI